MARDEKSTSRSLWKSVWKELLRIRVSIVIGILLGLSVIYLLLWSPNPDNRWFGLALALIPNIVSAGLIVVFGYIFLHNLEAIRSEQERDALITEIREETRNVVAGELQTMQRTMDKFFTHNELGNTAHSLGIANITSNWVELINSQHPLGANFRHHLSNVKSPATWYILTMSPSALRDLDEEIRGAVKRGVNVKWVYYAVETIDSNPAIKTQWECISRFPDRTGPTGREVLKKRISVLLDDFGPSLRNEIHKLGKEHQKDVGNLEFYESEMVHPYLAFLSVPEEYKELPQPAPPEDTQPEDALPKLAPAGTFGFVHLYPIFPLNHQERPALCLDASGGKILDEYYWSTLRLFDRGVRLGKIRCTWSLKT